MLKKTILAIVLCCMMCSPLTMTALAADMPYSTNTIITLSELTPAQQALFPGLYDQIRDFRTELTLPAGTAYDDASAVMDVLTEDMPELFYLVGGYSISYYGSTPDIANAVNVSYKMSPAMAASCYDALMARAAVIANGASGTAEERELYLHDYLAIDITYGTVDENQYNAWGALMDHICVCEGYADAMNLLCRMNGIPCSKVSGTGISSEGAGPHAWNVVEINGYRCQVDATWDSNGTTKPGPACHWYFNMSSADMGVNHVTDDWHTGGRDAVNMNWHSRRGLTAHTNQEARDIIMRQMPDLVNYDTPVELKLVDGASYDWVEANLGSIMEEYARASGVQINGWSWNHSNTGMFVTIALQNNPE